MTEKEKLLVTSNFSFSQNIFQGYISYMRQNAALSGNGLNLSQALVFIYLQYKSFENTAGKGEIACKEQFLLFPQCFLPFGELSAIFIKFKIVVCKLFQRSLKFVIWERVIPFPNKPWFIRVCNTTLLKPLWEKDKLLVTSNLSFSHSVFNLFGELSAIFINFKIVVCKLFQFGRV